MIEVDEIKFEKTMKRALMRSFFFSVQTPNLLPPTTFKSNPNLSSLQLSIASTPSELKFYSSSSENDSIHTQKKKDAPVDVEDVSNQELKMLVEKYTEGDGEAIPLIFEAILKRKLAGKHEETDDEFMEELRQKPVNDVKCNESDFESDFNESDEE